MNPEDELALQRAVCARLKQELAQVMHRINVPFPISQTDWRTHEIVACPIEAWNKFWSDRGIE